MIIASPVDFFQPLGMLQLLIAVLIGWGPPLSPLHVTRPFAPGPTPYSPGHRGIDLAGLPGDPVISAGAGRVVYAGILAGRGVVSVDHGHGLRTTYEPVTASVVRNQEVARGTVLGTLATGHAGCPAPACVHVGLRRGEDDYLNPMSLLGRGRVRLVAP